MKLKTFFPRYTKFLLAIAYTLMLNGTVIRAIDYRLHAYIFYVMLLTGCIALIISGVITIKIYDYAKYYLASWLVLLLIIAIICLRIVNVYIPHFTLNMMSYGGCLEVLFLSFALARRFQLIREEREELKLLAIKNEFNLQSLKMRNELLEKDLDLAREVQRRIIPELSGDPRMAALFLPMEKVGGDFFEVLDLKPDLKGIFFCDVTGHGVSAAFITALVKSTISNELKRFHLNPDSGTWLLDPGKTFAHLNDIMAEHTSHQYLSAVYGIFNPVQNTFEFVMANHPPLIYLTAGKDGNSVLEFIRASPQSLLLGVMKKDKYNSAALKPRIFKLEPDSKLILASDGLFDCIDYSFKNHEKGLESFKETPAYEILKIGSGLNIEDFNSGLYGTILDSLKSSVPPDDICVLTIHT